MEDIIKSIKAILYERLTSPLAGTFLFSWALWNYKIILVLFSGLEIDDKLVKLEKLTEFSSVLFDGYFYSGVLYPLATTIVILFLYPLPARFVFEHTRQSQKKLKEIKQQIDDETPLTKEESQRIRALMSELQTTTKRELDEKNVAINQHNDEIAKGLAEIEQLKAAAIEEHYFKDLHERIKRGLQLNRSSTDKKTYEPVQEHADLVKKIRTLSAKDMPENESKLVLKSTLKDYKLPQGIKLDDVLTYLLARGFIRVGHGPNAQEGFGVTVQGNYLINAWEEPENS